jgi:hypothetical protein
VLDSSFNRSPQRRHGFKNLEDLRTLIFRYGEFRTAEEVGLKLPRPSRRPSRSPWTRSRRRSTAHTSPSIEEILSNPNPEAAPAT